eukprot:scaffold15.g4273.t1
MDYLRSWFSSFSSTGSKEAPQKELERKHLKLRHDRLGVHSGACSSNDGSVKTGWATMRGKRPCQEDQVYCQFHPLPREGGDASSSSSPRSESVWCGGVFDGHGGPAAARFVRDHVFANLLNHQHFNHNLFKDDGCTAVTAVVVGRRLIVAHVGDSRGVLSFGRCGIALTADHKPNRSDERARIEDAGGAVVWAGTWRVSGVLAVSRSFGNRHLKEYIIPHPEIREDALSSENRCLVLATDGLWDVLTNQEAIDLLQACADPELGAKELVAEAYRRGSMDNISAVVAFFNFAGDATATDAQTPQLAPPLPQQQQQQQQPVNAT